MAWIHRDVYLPVLLLGAGIIASCASTPPPTQDCEYVQGPNGLMCVVPTTGGTNGNAGTSGAGGGSGGKSCIPGLTCPEDQAGNGGTGITAGSGGSVSPAGGTGMVSSTGGTGVVAGTGGTGPTAGSGGSGPVGGDGGTVSVGGGGSGGGGGSTGGVLGTIVVDAGALARDHSIVSFALPSAQGKNVALRDSQGNQVALQVDADGEAYFVVASMAAGSQATYTIEELPAAPAPGVTTDIEGEHLFVKQGDKTVFRWLLVPDNFRNRQMNDVRAGYIYPLYTPGGVSVADDYAEDHPHMHGIWSAWTLTTFRGEKVDFWNGYDNSGHNDLEQVNLAWDGAVHAGFTADIKHEAIKYTPWVKVLHETWAVRVYKTHEGAAPYYVFDIDSVQQCAGNEQLDIEQYTYGGFGFRGSEEWQGANGVSFLTSEGLTRTNGDGTRARWVAQYGTVSGKVGGYAGLGHPTNLRHPQGIRIHPSNPYWSFTPVTLASGGRYVMMPGMPLHSRFRVVVFDGAADAALLNRLWDDFATPPTVTVQ